MPTRPRWRGPAIAAIALLHTTFTLVVSSGVGWTPEMLALTGGRAPLAQMVPGFGAADPPPVGVLCFFWSIAFGAALALLGLLVAQLERAGQRVPAGFGWGLLAL